MSRTLSPRAAGLASACIAAVLLAACGKSSAPAASQVAARVNKQEISVHQINFMLQRQPGLKPEQAEAGGRQILERLIDQELAVQKAEDLKLERQPQVLLALEAARKEIIARAYADHVVAGVAKPTPAEVQAYFDDKPALFAQRRIYALQELQVQLPPTELGPLRDKVQSSKSIDEVLAYLKEKNLPMRASQQTTAAENLPLDVVDRFATLKPGQAVLMAAAGGARIVVVQDARPAPVTIEQASPRIEQAVLNERRRQAVENDLKAVRSAAKLEYVGKFAEKAAPAPAGAPPAAAPAAPAAAPAASGALDSSVVDKGLSGLK